MVSWQYLGFNTHAIVLSSQEPLRRSHLEKLKHRPFKPYLRKKTEQPAITKHKGAWLLTAAAMVRTVNRTSWPIALIEKMSKEFIPERQLQIWLDKTA
jgi:hypothetical protein